MKPTTISRLLGRTTTLSALALPFLLFSHANAQSTLGMGASQQLSVGAMSILGAPAGSVVGSVKGAPEFGSALAAMGSYFVVSGIAQGAGDSVELALDASTGAGKASVKIARSAFEKAGVSVGTTVQAVTESTGTLLIASGKLLAFIPNKVGEALLYNARVPGADPQ